MAYESWEIETYPTEIITLHDDAFSLPLDTIYYVGRARHPYERDQVVLRNLGTWNEMLSRDTANRYVLPYRLEPVCQSVQLNTQGVTQLLALHPEIKHLHKPTFRERLKRRFQTYKAGPMENHLVALIAPRKPDESE